MLCVFVYATVLLQNKKEELKRKFKDNILKMYLV